SHNAYLDAMISSGLAGGILLLAMIGAAMRSLWRSRKRTCRSRTRTMLHGLMVALIAVSVHDIFIYNQIPTALYFFALMALSAAAANVVAAESQLVVPREGEAMVDLVRSRHLWKTLIPWTLMATGAALFAVACWHALMAAKSDRAIKAAFTSGD